MRSLRIEAFAIVVAFGLLLGGCVSPECRAEIDRCLSSCPPDDSPAEGTELHDDSRDTCEQRCHRKCTWL